MVLLDEKDNDEPLAAMARRYNRLRWRSVTQVPDSNRNEPVPDARTTVSFDPLIRWQLRLDVVEEELLVMSSCTNWNYFSTNFIYCSITRRI